MPTPSESPIVARVRALVAKVNNPQSPLEELEARLGSETDPEKIVALARDIDMSKTRQTHSQSSIEDLEARLGSETDPQEIVALAQKIDSMKSAQEPAARTSRRRRFW